jgi:2-polyprenyl-3-methyl-5-hydroxy-6-metoxy-1,4-benzoquinol methylase
VDTAEQNIEIKNGQTLDTDFEDLYIAICHREKRLLTDCQLMFLPDIEPTHIHYKEWQIRKHSSQKLIAYLKKKNKPLNILEIGCGNGWLSSNMAAIKNTNVIGLDINGFEIDQAKRVFKKSNLKFMCEYFYPGMFSLANFDIILFAASISYFPMVKSILRDALACLAADGEIHIMDTPFYKRDEIEDAAQSSNNHFKVLGYPEMGRYYFHHAINDIKQFNYKFLANPSSLINRIKKTEPFYWVSINH